MKLGSTALNIISLSSILEARMGNRDKVKDVAQSALSVAWIIEYIAVNSNEDIFQKDIERHFCMTRSAASKMLVQLERNGLIERYRVTRDARLKKLVLTDAGKKAAEQIHKEAKIAEADMTSNLTSDEQHFFASILTKINLHTAE